MHWGTQDVTTTVIRTWLKCDSAKARPHRLRLGLSSFKVRRSCCLHKHRGEDRDRDTRGASERADGEGRCTVVPRALASSGAGGRRTGGSLARGDLAGARRGRGRGGRSVGIGRAGDLRLNLRGEGAGHASHALSSRVRQVRNY